MPQTYWLGKDAKVYQGASGDALAAMDEVPTVREVTLTLEASEADITTRGNSGWRATAPGLRECSAEFQLLWKPGDTTFDAVKTAYLNGSVVRLGILAGDKSPDGVATVPGSEGPLGDFSITGFSRNEPLEEGITVSVTAKLAAFDEWVVDGLEAA